MSLLQRDYEARKHREALRVAISGALLALAVMLLMFAFGFQLGKNWCSAAAFFPALAAGGRPTGGRERAFTRWKGLFTRSLQATRAGEV
jgi:cation transport ATPase